VQFFPKLISFLAIFQFWERADGSYVLKWC